VPCSCLAPAPSSATCGALDGAESHTTLLGAVNSDSTEVPHPTHINYVLELVLHCCTPNDCHNVTVINCHNVTKLLSFFVFLKFSGLFSQCKIREPSLNISNQSPVFIISHAPALHRASCTKTPAALIASAQAGQGGYSRPLLNARRMRCNFSVDCSILSFESPGNNGPCDSGSVFFC
jgi:hypothetical protein